jgi:putative transposase
LSEAEVHWSDFFRSLVKRGLHGIETITSDDHAGLGAARKSVFPGVKWQRCQFHLQQNASSHVPKKSMNDDVHGAIRNVFNAPDKNEAQRLLNKAVEAYSEEAGDLSDWMAENIPEGLTVFDLPEAKRKKLRTSNMAELQNKELKKRTRLIRVFPNKESLLRIASAILMELDEEWLSADKRYMKMER